MDGSTQWKYNVCEPIRTTRERPSVMYTFSPSAAVCAKIAHTELEFNSFIFRILRICLVMTDLSAANIRHNNSPRPKFETDADRTYFAATFPIHSKAKTAQAMADSTPQVTPPKSNDCYAHVPSHPCAPSCRRP